MNKNEITQVQKQLKSCGWPVRTDGDMGPQTRAAVREFQAGLHQVKAAGKWRRRRLPVNGKPGIRTRRALKQAAESGGHCSRNFMFRDWKSRGNGWVKVNRELVAGLEEYRRKLGKPVVIVSGYRDPAYNAKVGGARLSQHMDGDAADLVPVVTLGWVRGLRRFNGIGVQKQSGLVRHVDVGHTSGSVENPVVWFYN